MSRMATVDVIREADLYLEDFLKGLSECGVVGSYTVQFLEERHFRPQLAIHVQQLITNMKSLLLKLGESLCPIRHAEVQTDEISDCSLCKCQDSLTTPLKPPSAGESEGELEPNTQEKAFKPSGLLHLSSSSSSPPVQLKQEVTCTPESVSSHCPGVEATVSDIDDKYPEEEPDTALPEGVMYFVCTRKPAGSLPLGSRVLSTAPSSKDPTEVQAENEAVKKLGNMLATMTSVERLSAVINVIYEKAVNEESLSRMCAKISQVLSLMSVDENGSKSNSGKQEVRFRNLIINKCQKEFEDDDNTDFRIEKLKEIEECTDLRKKQELQAELIYGVTKLKNRNIGIIRFIGELYKVHMLTSTIMLRVIGTLLERGDEEALECLCELLTIIGKVLEVQCTQQAKAKSELDKCFKKLEEIVQDDQTAARVRSLVMGVIDLRQKSWLPRREDDKTKTEAQVQKVKIEEFEQQLQQLTNIWQWEAGDSKWLRKNRSSQMSDENWRSVASNRGRAFRSSRLSWRNVPPNRERAFGSSQLKDLGPEK